MKMFCYEEILSKVLKELKEEDISKWNGAAEHYNALVNYICPNTSNRELVFNALLIIRDELNRIGGFYNGGN